MVSCGLHRSKLRDPKTKRLRCSKKCNTGYRKNASTGTCQKTKKSTARKKTKSKKRKPASKKKSTKKRKPASKKKSVNRRRKPAVVYRRMVLPSLTEDEGVEMSTQTEGASADSPGTFSALTVDQIRVSTGTEDFNEFAFRLTSDIFNKAFLVDDVSTFWAYAHSGLPNPTLTIDEKMALNSKWNFDKTTQKFTDQFGLELNVQKFSGVDNEGRRMDAYHLLEGTEAYQIYVFLQFTLN